MVRPKIINHGSANNTKLYFLLKSLDLNVVSTTVNYGRKPTKFWNSVKGLVTLVLMVSYDGVKTEQNNDYLQSYGRFSQPHSQGNTVLGWFYQWLLYIPLYLIMLWQNFVGVSLPFIFLNVLTSTLYSWPQCVSRKEDFTHVQRKILTED